MSIAEFLLARIAEDEEVAREAVDSSGWGSSPDGRWEIVEVPYEGEWPRNPDAEDGVWSNSEWAIHASRHDPARVLRECAAKRSVVEKWQDNDSIPTWKREETFFVYGIDLAVHALAAIYSDHPDYQEEWCVG